MHFERSKVQSSDRGSRVSALHFALCVPLTIIREWNTGCKVTRMHEEAAAVDSE